jgi:hypothetical protein
MPRRCCLYSFLAGCGVFFAAYLIKAALARVGMPPPEPLLDNALLGILAAVGLYFFLRYRDTARALRRRRHELAIAHLNHHVRNALQLIVNRTAMEMHSVSELRDIRYAVNRIDWALREILPLVNVNPEPRSSGYPRATASAAGQRAPGELLSFKTGTGPELIERRAKGRGSEAEGPPDEKISVTE